MKHLAGLLAALSLSSFASVHAASVPTPSGIVDPPAEDKYPEYLREEQDEDEEIIEYEPLHTVYEETLCPEEEEFDYDDEEEEDLEESEYDYEEEDYDVNERSLIVEREGDETSSTSVRRLVSGVTSDFGPLSQCNDNLESVSCTGSLQALITSAGGGAVTIPCGDCVMFDLADGSDTTIGGLNIDGKLLKSSSDSAILRTPYVFVQGILEVTQNDIISPANQSLKIILTGTTSQTFSPHADNPGSCSGSGCDVGTKPFIIAGGQMKINCISDTCETWTKLTDVIKDPVVVPTTFPQAVSHPDQTNCASGTIIQHDFSTGDFHGWTGNYGATCTPTPTGMAVENRKGKWQGPLYDMSSDLGCILPDTDYLLSIQLTLSSTTANVGDPTECKLTNSNCLRVRRRIHYHSNGNSSPNDASSPTTLISERKESAGNYGETQYLSATVRFSENDLHPDNRYTIVYIDNVPEDVDITLESVLLALPDASVTYPTNAATACQELIMNGDAEGNNFNPYPFTYSNSGNRLMVLEEDDGGNINRFYRLVNRGYSYDSLNQYLNVECIQPYQFYSASARIRVHSGTTDVAPYIRLRGDGGSPTFDIKCDPQNESNGWVTCSGDFLMFSENMGTTSEVRFQINSDGYLGDIDYDDMSVTFKEGPVTGLVLDKDVSACWGVGSEVMITPHTNYHKDVMIRTITSVTANNIVTLDSGIPPPTTHVDYATEVALLTRNCMVEGEDVDDENKGAHLMVMHTPGVKQSIVGMGFENMGQVAKADRFPINLASNTDITNTTISKNTIRNSHHRCINIDKSSGITVADNVAYYTAGHCYYVLGLYEVNTLTHNLGAYTYTPSSQLSGTKDKDDPSTFLIHAPATNLISNVAAGSSDRGYWFDFNSGARYNVVFGSFVNNVAHSNQGYGLRLDEYETTKGRAYWIGNKIYRNKHRGMYLYDSGHVTIDGGVYADNRIQIEMYKIDRVEMNGVKVYGETDLYKTMALTQGENRMCYSDKREPIWGIKHSTFLNRENWYRGLEMNDVTMADFDKVDDVCTEGTSMPIYLGTVIRDKHWDYFTTYKNMNVVDERNLMIDGCAAENKGVDDILITVEDSSINPIPGSTFTGSSSIVSPTSQMMTFAPNGCVQDPIQCLAYCQDSCFRTVDFLVEDAGTEDWKLYVTNGPDSIEVGGKFYYSTSSNPLSVNKHEEKHWRLRKFSVSLPAGNYVAEFRNGAGQVDYPTFVDELWRDEPPCAGSAGPGSVTVTIPTPTANECDNLVKNGDIEGGTDPNHMWHPFHTKEAGIQYMPSAGVNGSNAIGTFDRDNVYDGLGQYIDTRCVKANIGRQYEFTADIQVYEEDGTTIADCNTEHSSTSTGCPEVTIYGRWYDDAPIDRVIKGTYYYDEAKVLRPYKMSGWNVMHGVFTIQDKYNLFDRVFWYTERHYKKDNVVLDNVAITPLDDTCDDLVLNGGFDTGNSKYWDARRENNMFEIVTGVDGVGYAAKVSQRDKTYSTPHQRIKNMCFQEGEQYIAKARFQVHEGGTTTLYACDPESNSGVNRCPQIRIASKYKLEDGTTGDAYHNVGKTASPVHATGWNTMAGVFYANKYQAGAFEPTLYWEYLHTSNDLTVDDVSIVPRPMDCNGEYILNPDFEDGTSSFWEVNSRANSRMGMYSPGADESNFALRNYARKGNGYGVYIRWVDHRCFTANTELKLSAKFMLLDENSTAVSCDPEKFSEDNTNCPMLQIKAYSCETSGTNYWSRMWNDKVPTQWDSNGNPIVWEPRPWVADQYNTYEHEFVVDPYLATCTDVRIYIEDVNDDWDIVMDDIKLTRKVETTPAPVESSTPAPAGTTLIDTPTSTPTISPAPTATPTAAPTVVAIGCPQLGEDPITINAGYVNIIKAQPDQLCTLTKITASGSVVPVSRSYDTNDWEKAAGTFAEDALRNKSWNCKTNACQIELPTLDAGETYVLTSYHHSLPQHKDEVARLLQSTTFGTTKAQLDTWNYQIAQDVSAANWVYDQIMVEEMTSHREFFRLRANARWMQPERIGIPDHPCMANSRWRKFSMTRKDRSKNGSGNMKYLGAIPSNEATGEGPYVLTVNGAKRTAVADISFENQAYFFNVSQEYDICSYPSETIGGSFKVRVNDCSSDCCQKINLGNPEVNFTGLESHLDPNYVIDFDVDLEIVVIDEHRTGSGEQLMLPTGLDESEYPECNSLPDIFDQGDYVYGKLPDGTWLIHDPRLDWEDNTLDAPIPGGGGLTRQITSEKTYCANAPRTFLNIDDCVLSTEASACTTDLPVPPTEILLDDTNIKQLHQLTSRYAYGMLGLPVRDFLNNTIPHPCTQEIADHRSRWERNGTTCTNPTPLQNATLVVLTNLLENTNDGNPIIRDIRLKADDVCDPDDTDPEIYIQVGSQCWKHVHPDHLSVYDLTFWTEEMTHPGNMVAAMENETNPIKKWMDEKNTSLLIFPSTHPEPDSGYDHPATRWDIHHKKFDYVGRYMDTILFRDLPEGLHRTEVAEYYGASGEGSGAGILVCGSPNEVANDPSLGLGFDVAVDSRRDTSDVMSLSKQREVVWTMVVLLAKDQLRQRMAWALSQTLVIATSAIATRDRNSEIFLAYYDIFVRNAFGNYRDVLKEISYSPMMAENLSYLRSKSHAYILETENKYTFADENFAREIMQLFSTGLVLLNMDGTANLDAQGKEQQVYTNEDIMSFARVWTGFDWRSKGRANFEDYQANNGNRIDPMFIDARWRDRFPKTDLYGGYIGDGHPLCVDLPEQMFLRPGARYRLLGGSGVPELMENENELKFDDDESIIRFELDANSQLKSELCNDGGSGCEYPNQVVLDTKLNCTANECNVDTVRTVKVNNVYYEYVRPSCVELSFYNDAVKLSRRYKSWSGTMCANTALPAAGEACCCSTCEDAVRNVVYDGERMTFSKAASRCVEFGTGYSVCDYDEIGTSTHKTGYHWTTDSCGIQVRVRPDGEVTIVHNPEEYSEMVLHVARDNRNYFGVTWDRAPSAYPMDDGGGSCTSAGCVLQADGNCLCEATVHETVVFQGMPTSKEEVLSKLKIGAMNPAAYVGLHGGTYETITSNNGVTAHRVGGTYGLHTIFEVTDDKKRTHFLKNAASTVHIGDTYSFRNPPHFMSMIPTETDERDAQYETEAALDHYFYHDNTAPFLAYRFIQRFEISNPSPRYIETVSMAFRDGTYASGGQTFGLGKYGDLAAMVAAVVLDPEARTPVLDADPSHGSLREPILKVLALMRNMEFNSTTYHIQLEKMDEVIGQMAHELPTVFSFFLPEYIPDGRISHATLVAPEAQLLDMPKISGILDGMFSMVERGLSSSDNGFGTSGSSRGDLEYQPAPGSTSDEIVDELATLLTAGRLSPENRQIIKDSYEAASTDDALQVAQKLITTSAEFHSTNIVVKSGEAREDPPPPVSNGEPYKAVVALMFAGGCDSYNMLIPHTCTLGTDMYAQYSDIRGQVALVKTSTLDINSTDQVCEKFGIHPGLPILKELYDEKSALFLANTGVLEKPSNKDNYRSQHVTQLFAHNTMQRETKRVDPEKECDGTGVMGRMADALTENNYATGSFSIERNSIMVIGKPAASPAVSIVGRDGVDQIFEGITNEAERSDILEKIRSLNNATRPDSGFMAETWSNNLYQSLDQNELLYQALLSVPTDATFPDTTLGRQLETVARMMKTAGERGVNRDMYYVQIGGFDTHSSMLANLAGRFDEVNGALTAFVNYLKDPANDLYDSVTLLEVSDFARTLSPNSGDGTDHAWGGNYFMLGGAVDGGKIMGTYPDDFTDDGPLNLGRGRMLPTTSWDAVWNSVAQWVGIQDPAQLDDICPNRDQFSASDLFSEADLFKSGVRRVRERKRFLRRQ